MTEKNLSAPGNRTGSDCRRDLDSEVILAKGWHRIVLPRRSTLTQNLTSRTFFIVGPKLQSNDKDNKKTNLVRVIQ